MKYVGQSVPMLTNRVLAAGRGTFVAGVVWELACGRER